MVKVLSLLSVMRRTAKSASRYFYAHPKADIKPDIAYHGSPFNFNSFDVSKIGSGEGFSKTGKGIYLYRTPKYAPYYANIRSKDAPIHLGNTRKLDNPQPTVYTVSGLSKLNIKQVRTGAEKKSIVRNQDAFEKMYPQYDGIETPDTEICIFPKSVHKLNIAQKQSLLEFISERKDFPFRTWRREENLSGIV